MIQEAATDYPWSSVQPATTLCAVSYPATNCQTMDLPSTAGDPLWMVSNGDRLISQTELYVKFCGVIVDGTRARYDCVKRVHTDSTDGATWKKANTGLLYWTTML